jgi:hypothetical protein
MRLLRALAHLVLAIAILAAGGAQACPVGLMSAAPQSHDHRAMTASVEQAVHDHGSPARERPVHKRDTCQTLCCISPVQLVTRAPIAWPVLFSAVRYDVAASSAVGRTYAPEPGVPKRTS